ncbi:MAG: chemotaxis protein CheB [Asticcacaulis sp.]
MKTPPPQAVVIGVSAGGIKALSDILPALPADFPLPILVVLHLPADKDSLITSLFADKCALSVVEAEDKLPIEPGTIYFAPPDYHLLVEKGRYLSLSSEEPVLYSRPSIDVLFESAADVYGEGLIGIVLTGANQDGAKGLQAVTQAGGQAWVECPAHAYSAVMPEAAIALNPTATILSLDEMARRLQKAALS